MADSTTHLDTISASQSSKEVSANALFDAMSANALFGRRGSTATGLTWGYYGGKFQRPADSTIVEIANGTIALTASATNYLYADAAGVVTKVTAAPAGWPAPLANGALALYEVVTDGSGATSYEDYRAPLRPQDVHSSTSKATPVDADEIPLCDSAASFALKKLTWANLKATLKTYFDTLYATVAQPFDVTAFYPSTLTSSAKVLRVPLARAVTFPANFAGSYGKASANATGSTAFDVQKNGSSIGTITFAAGASTATFVTSGGTQQVFAAGDVLAIIAPAVADATLADVGFVLTGSR